MQRSLSGIFFLVASVLFGIAVGLWWMTLTVLSPNATTGAAQAILGDTEIRGQLTSIVTGVASGPLEQTPQELAVFVDRVLRSRPGAAVASEITEAAHERILGLRTEPVQIDGRQLTEIVRDDRVLQLDPVTIPIADVAGLQFFERTSGWAVLVTLALAVVATIAGFIVRPERIDIARGFAELLISVGLGLVVVGFLLPYYVLPAIDDTTWVGAIRRLAGRTAVLDFTLALVLVGIGGYILARLHGGDTRRSSWSSTTPTTRFRGEQRRWS